MFSAVVQGPALFWTHDCWANQNLSYLPVVSFPPCYSYRYSYLFRFQTNVQSLLIHRCATLGMGIDARGCFRIKSWTTNEMKNGSSPLFDQWRVPCVLSMGRLSIQMTILILYWSDKKDVSQVPLAHLISGQLLPNPVDCSWGDSTFLEVSWTVLRYIFSYSAISLHEFPYLALPLSTLGPSSLSLRSTNHSPDTTKSGL